MEKRACEWKPQARWLRSFLYEGVFLRVCFLETFLKLGNEPVGGFTPAKSGRPREKAKGNIRQDLSGRGDNEGGTTHTTQDAMHKRKMELG